MLHLFRFLDRRRDLAHALVALHREAGQIAGLDRDRQPAERDLTAALLLDPGPGHEVLKGVGHVPCEEAIQSLQSVTDLVPGLHTVVDRDHPGDVGKNNSYGI